MAKIIVSYYHLHVQRSFKSFYQMQLIILVSDEQGYLRIFPWYYHVSLAKTISI